MVFERYEKKKDVFVESKAIKYRFMASFGRDTAKIFDKTNQVVNNIFASASLLEGHYLQRQGHVPMEPDEDNTSISAIGVLLVSITKEIALHVYHNKYAAVPLDASLLSKHGIRKFEPESGAPGKIGKRKEVAIR